MDKEICRQLAVAISMCMVDAAVFASSTMDGDELCTEGIERLTDVLFDILDNTH